MPNPLLAFMQSLWVGGDLVLTTSAGPTIEDAAACLPSLRTLESEYRRGLAGELPAVSLPAASWALTALYRACQFLVFRELPEEQLRAELSLPCPETPSPLVCYSVDLSLRFLPDVVRMARAANAHDPLVERLLTWATDWPLSSVGITGVTAGSIEAFIDDASLRTLYVDRILATNDQSRLSDDRVAEAVRAALGGFRELSPAIYDVVQRTS